MRAKVQPTIPSRKQLLMGNQAIALGLVENGVRTVTAYPGTPSSEILTGVLSFKRQMACQVYTEWSVNEKVAFEVALAASWVGIRAAVAMKQVGLNVASDPLFSAAYTGTVGGFVVISADDPGPHSSQTEQDSRLLALAAKVPVFDPSSPDEARRMTGLALDLSERHRVPVMLRPTTRLCHAVQDLPVEDIPKQQHNPAKFTKDRRRWTATPPLRHALHRELNQKLRLIEAEFEDSPLNFEVDAEVSRKLGIIASGVDFHTARQALLELGVQVPILKIGTPFPMPRKRVGQFAERFGTVLVLEEPDACIELQLSGRGAVRGRLDGTVPNAGELTPEVVYDVLAAVLKEAGLALLTTELGVSAMQALVDGLPLPSGKPRLCAGCAHRSAFFVMRREAPGAIFPGDIGCYTLGTNLRAVDTFVDMGASVAMASGFYHANQMVEDSRCIVATIGDSTFLHAGLPALINAVHSGARFVLLILDNHTTAMTGFQPTAADSTLADGGSARAVSIPDLVRACGVDFVEKVDPYDQQELRRMLRVARDHTLSPAGGVAVIVAERPCVLHEPDSVGDHLVPVEITQDCDGCRYCLEAFDCPALVLSADGSRVDLDENTCVQCGQCIDACFKGFIVPRDTAS